MGWIDFFYFFIFGAAFLLSSLGLWFAAIIPGLDRWSKRFFVTYFISFILSCLSGLLEMYFEYSAISVVGLYLSLILESLFLSVPLPMLTVYVLHSCGEKFETNRLFKVVMGLWVVYTLVLLSALFIRKFASVTDNMVYNRGPLYPILLLPIVSISFINVAATIKNRSRLSHRVFLSLLLATVPLAITLIVQLFVEVFWLLDISIVLSGLSMYGLVLSDQIEQNLRQQREIANQKANIMVLQMRPHFIYNTLMSIYSLCNIDPQKARQVTLDFTNYLRKNFNAISSDSTIPFSAELEHTRAYLLVEQAQYEDMLKVGYDTEVIHFRVPPLTLQPIVENAIKHGMDPYSGPLHVLVQTRQTDSGIEITVKDNGPGFDPKEESTPQSTLTNISQRLEMMCGGTMTIAPRDGGGTVVRVTIPSR